MSRRLAATLDALAGLGARIVIVLDAGARWLEGPIRPQEDHHEPR